MTLHLFIEPLDVWLFRDGKPFNRSTDHLARSIFPPLPSVLQGVIRSHFIELHGGIPAYLADDLPDVAAHIGAPGEPPPDTFRLQGPFIAGLSQNGQLTRYFPLPAHAYRDNDQFRLLEPESRDSILTNLDPKFCLLRRKADTEPTKDKSEGGVWLDEDSLKKLLRQRQLPASFIKEGKQLFRKEIRLGIARNDDTHSTQTGDLYEAEFIRLCQKVDTQIGLYVAVDGLPNDWPDIGLMDMGGEGHQGRYRELSPPPLPLENISAGSNGLTVTFLTPTYFREGWQPANQDWTPFFDRPLKCVAVALGRFQVIGGFDVARKRHKPSRRYVPAGSTYYFEGSAIPRLPVICENPVDVNGSETEKIDHIGFGQFILGGW
jgi:CRISPR-associated protein Cmr3